MKGISCEEFDEIISPYSSLLGNHVVVAVSGGADSMALCLLMNEWCIKNKLQLTSITVNHNLRKESLNEAEMVQEWLSSRNIAHTILTCSSDIINNRIQEKARDARYALLVEWCIKHQATSLLTAHHIFDQWETFMIRLSKGSGLKGLCGIRSFTPTDFGYLLRPLLAIEPDRLQSTLKRFNQDFVKDPSNDQEKFTRVKWRKLYPALSKMELNAHSIAKSIADIQQINEFIELQVVDGLNQCWKAPHLNINFFEKLPKVVRYRLLSDVIIEVGRAKYPVSRDLIKRIDKMLLSNSFKTLTAGHCLLKKKGIFLVVIPEKKL